MQHKRVLVIALTLAVMALLLVNTPTSSQDYLRETQQLSAAYGCSEAVSAVIIGAVLARVDASDASRVLRDLVAIAPISRNIGMKPVYMEYYVLLYYMKGMPFSSFENIARAIYDRCVRSRQSVDDTRLELLITLNTIRVYEGLSGIPRLALDLGISPYDALILKNVFMWPDDTSARLYKELEDLNSIK